MKKENSDLSQRYASIVQILEEALKPAYDMKQKMEQLLDYQKKTFSNLEALSKELHEMSNYKSHTDNNKLNLTIQPIFGELCEKTRLLTEFFPAMLITQTKESVVSITSMIEKQNELFKGRIKALIETKKNFDNEVKQCEFNNVTEALKNGFQIHQSYLQYFFNVRNISNDILESLKTIQENIVKTNKSFEKSLKYCNGLFVAKFNEIADPQKDYESKANKGKKTNLNQFKEEVLMIIEHCKNAIRPKLSSLSVPQINLPAWNSFTNEACLKLICEEKFIGNTSTGEISVEKGEIVDLIEKS